MAAGQIAAIWADTCEFAGGSGVGFSLNDQLLNTNDVGVLPINLVSGDTIRINAPVQAEFAAFASYVYVDAYTGMLADFFVSRTFFKPGEGTKWGGDNNDWKLIFIDAGQVV